MANTCFAKNSVFCRSQPHVDRWCRLGLVGTVNGCLVIGLFLCVVAVHFSDTGFNHKAHGQRTADTHKNNKRTKPAFTPTRGPKDIQTHKSQQRLGSVGSWLWVQCMLLRLSEARWNCIWTDELRRAFSPGECNVISVALDGTRLGGFNTLAVALYAPELRQAAWSPPQGTLAKYI